MEVSAGLVSSYDEAYPIFGETHGGPCTEVAVEELMAPMQWPLEVVIDNTAGKKSRSRRVRRGGHRYGARSTLKNLAKGLCYTCAKIGGRNLSDAAKPATEASGHRGRRRTL